MLYKHKTKLNDKGFASIVIALVLITVLALVTIGFAQLARREQRSALDKQLANQAYYAAETGINDTVKALPAIAAAGSAVHSDQCLDTAHFSMNSTINQTNGVYYTCVLVNLKPPDIEYKNVASESERYISFSTDPSPLTSLTIEWDSSDGKKNPRNSSGFPPFSQWGDSPGVLEASLTPTPASLSNTSLAANTFTAYLYPSASAGSVGYSTSSSGQGKIVSGGCHNVSGVYSCSVTINGVPASADGQYLLRIVNHYDPSNISVTGQTASGAAKFIGQPQIDVTGKAQEVLKRIQVRISANTSYDLPNDVIESQDTCKRFSVDPINPPVFDTALSAACQLNN